jgi:Protein of unknown function (DUF3551)
MRALAGVIFATAVIVGAEPTRAQMYDRNYPVCMEADNGEGSHIDCAFTSIEQCKNGVNSTERCFTNPYYKPPPPEPEPVAEAAPPPPPAKAAKSKKTKQ